MTARVVVLGAGYAGTRAIQRLEGKLGDDDELVWISAEDYHLVRHEVHRCIRNPDVEDHVCIDVDDVRRHDTRFVEDRVVGIDADERAVELADRETVDYDYLLVALGSKTAFFGIPGLAEHAHTLKTVADATGIHDEVRSVADDRGATDSVRVVVGGAGLSGVQAAGELAELERDVGADVDIALVEGLDDVLPNAATAVREPVGRLLDRAGVDVFTGEFVSEVDADTVYVGDETELPYDVLVWTGGITGPDPLEEAPVATDERSNRIETEMDFATSDDRIFALGDCALIEQSADDPAPPTAQAAWQAAEVAAENLARAVDDRPLTTWTYEDMGTVVSVGESAVAHDVTYAGVNAPLETFAGRAAKTLKKGIAFKWISSVAGYRRAAKAWPHM